VDISNTYNLNEFNDLGLISDYKSIVKNSIKNLLLMNWGERPFHYFLGANFRSTISNLSTANIKFLESKIRLLLSEKEDRIKVDSIKTSIDGAIINVIIFYTYTRTGNEDSLLVYFKENL